MLYFFQTCIIIEIFYYSGVLWFVKIIMNLIQIDYPNKLILVSEKKRIIRPEKNKAPLEEKQTIEANCRFGSERSEYLSTALKD